MRRGVYRHKVHSGASSEHRFSHEIWHFPAPGLISGKPKLATVSVRYGSIAADRDCPLPSQKATTLHLLGRTACCLSHMVPTYRFRSLEYQRIARHDHGIYAFSSSIASATTIGTLAAMIGI